LLDFQPDSGSIGRGTGISHGRCAILFGCAQRTLLRMR
jgi:hypothetical protein